MTFENGHENGQDSTFGRHYPPSRDEEPNWGFLYKWGSVVVAVIIVTTVVGATVQGMWF